MIAPLENYRVVDFGWVLAGALPGMILADMGGEVIKVETRRRLDYMRKGRPIFGDKPDPEQNPYFHNVNRSKFSITLDIKQPKGLELAKKLITISDVVIENLSPGTMEDIGLGYHDLKEIKTDIIMLSLSGAGGFGPLRDLRAYAPTINALSGLDSLVGYPNSENKVLGFKEAYGDVCASVQGVFAILAALWYRNRKGKGQYIDVSMLEATTVTLGEAIMDFIMNRRSPGPQGNIRPGIILNNYYRCQGEDKWVSIAIKTEEEWQNFCQALGNPSWAEEQRFCDQASQRQHHEALDRLITQWTSQYSPYDVMERLQAVGVAAIPLMAAEDRFVDQHYQARGLYSDIEHPAIGSEPIYNLNWKMSETPGKIQRRAPLLGEHNDYVFGRLLGLSKEEIDQLTEEKVIC